MPTRGDGSILVHVDPITAMGRRPFLASAWPWRAWTYLATASLPGALGLSVLAADLAVGGGLAKALIGLPLLAALALAGIPMGRVERWRLRLVDPAADRRSASPPGPAGRAVLAGDPRPGGGDLAGARLRGGLRDAAVAA